MLLAAPFAVVPYAMSQLALDRLARSAAGQLSSAAVALDEALPEPPDAPPELPLLPEARAIAELDGEEQPANESPTPRASSSAAPVAPHGLFVPRARVEAAVRAGHRPGGSSVGATAWRPAGLALVGVGGVGVGLRDGDVVTRVGGTPARSVGAVTSAVSAALDAGHPAINAEVWRGKQRIVVTIELPQS